MKKPLMILATIALVFSGVAMTYAEESGVVNVLVTIERSISIEIGTTTLDYGNLSVSQASVSTSPIAVTNDGSGTDETITLTVTDPAGWTQGIPGENIYKISFQFSDTQPLPDDLNWQTAASISESIAYTQTKNLWVKLETPTATSIVTQQTIPLTITAE